MHPYCTASNFQIYLEPKSHRCARARAEARVSAAHSGCRATVRHFVRVTAAYSLTVVETGRGRLTQFVAALDIEPGLRKPNGDRVQSPTHSTRLTSCRSLQWPPPSYAPVCSSKSFCFSKKRCARRRRTLSPALGIDVTLGARCWTKTWQVCWVLHPPN